jgi:OmpA-OmpF porin, OOP family
MTLTVRHFGAVIALALAVFAIPRAHAEDRPAWYIGANGGQSDLRPQGGFVSDIFMSQGTDTDLSYDKHHAAWSVNAGMQFNRWVALELDYFDFGTFDYSNGDSTLTGNFKAHGAGANVIGSIPLPDNFSVYGKVGVTRTRASLAVDPNAAGIGGSDTNHTGSVWGAGARWQFLPNWSANLEWARYLHVGEEATTGRADIDLVMAGVRFTF